MARCSDVDGSKQMTTMRMVIAFRSISSSFLFNFVGQAFVLYQNIFSR